MDLGATLCTRSSPDCEHCPLAKSCKAYAQGNPQDYPGKKPKKKLPRKNHLLSVDPQSQQGELLLQQNPPAGPLGRPLGVALSSLVEQS